MTDTFSALFRKGSRIAVRDDETELSRVLSRVAKEYSLSLADLREPAMYPTHSLARRAAALAARAAGFAPAQIARCMLKSPSSVHAMLSAADGEVASGRVDTHLAPAVMGNDYAPWEISAREQDRNFIRHMREIYPEVYTGDWGAA